MIVVTIPRVPGAALCGVIFLFLALTSVGAAQPSMSGVDPAPSIVMLRLKSPFPLTGSTKILDKAVLRQFYEKRRYRLAWDHDEAGLGAAAAIAYAVLATADAEGLDPEDYHVAEIGQLANASTVRDRIDRDFLITDGLVRYAADVSGGRLAPGQTDERTMPVAGLDCPGYIASAVMLSPEVFSAMLRTLPPATPEYRALRTRLAELRQRADIGGWLSLPDIAALHPGAHDPVVPLLRERLVAEGRIARGSGKTVNSDLYDSQLSAAIELFQVEHGIKPDGVIGKDTRAALDLPLEARIRQVVVNLERARWTDIPTTGRMVEVNLAAYSLRVYQDGQSVLAMPVVVGTPENPTPIIFSQITTIVLNPNWTLPPNVIREMLPRIHADEAYLAGKGIGRFENDGRVRLVQPPGPTNPLGHYKFIMPNDQDIYLHDSPDAAKFHYTLRAYSHGCVRLGNPAELAALLLDDRVASLPASLAELTQDWETKHIALSRPVPVALIYRTAWLDRNGQLVLGEDSYGRDQRLWKALHKPRGVSPTRRLAVQNSPASVL